MSTINAAHALGRSEEIGSLEAGKFANFAIVALPSEDAHAPDPYRLLFESDGPVVQTWFRGQLSHGLIPSSNATVY
jgi:imidazolonepropionase-like amidohydrolase